MADLARPGKPTAFEDLVDDYDAARPRYPAALYDALPPLGDALELGAGTGIASVPLGSLARSLVVSDLGPRMLARGLAKHASPGVVCTAEALPFADASFDTVCGAQMWHWTSAPAAPSEAVRVLRPGGRLLLWWNEVRAAGAWWEAQQDRLEAGNPSYLRAYREVDYGARLVDWFVGSPPVELSWERTISLELYERWLRSKSYVQELPDVDGFVAACRADLLAQFPDGQVVEPFVTRLWSLRRP
jgi:SAM-dependent methyltransferase